MHYFTSDTHFNHAKIIEVCSRPFLNVEEMNQALINNWNARVQPGDLIYLIGDVGLGNKADLLNILPKLKGQKFLVLGNHDVPFIKGSLKDKLRPFFIKIENMMEIKVPDLEKSSKRQRITLCHFAMKIWNHSHYGAWQLHGHSHGSLHNDPYSLQADVGVDCWNYSPVSYDELKEYMKTKDYKPNDYHSPRI
jgi:calcineurin-like phosphoesterase family protein